MKKLLIITTCLIALNIQSQSVTEIAKSHITVYSNADELREGLKQLEASCSTTPQEKCNKAKATALYLLADKYYEVAYNAYVVDRQLVKPILTQAEALYKRASSIMPLEDFPDYNVHVMTESKTRFETYLERNPD